MVIQNPLTKGKIIKLRLKLLTRRIIIFAVLIACILPASLHHLRAQNPLPSFRPGDLDEKFQRWLDEGRHLRSRRLFDQALACFDSVLEVDPLHEEATWGVAETHFKAHRWADAADWFDAVSVLAPQNREAYSRRWTAIMRFSEGDTLLRRSAVGAVRMEMADFLKEYPWDVETLSAARGGAVIVEDSLLSDELTQRILFNYPNSPQGYRLLSDRFYEGLYPIWNDPEKRIPYLREFLNEYPVSDFRETAWSYLIRALYETRDTTALRQNLGAWMAEDPQNPLPCERAVHYLLDFDEPPDSLLPTARKAVDLCRGWRGKPLKHVEQRIMEGKNLYAGTRLNIARVLLALGRDAEAQLWLQDGLKHSGFGVDDEGTTAAFDYFLGVIAQRAGQWENALDHYISALSAGDVRGEWTAKADSAAEKLFSDHFSDQGEDRKTLEHRRSGYSGPIFDDVTEDLGFGGIKGGRVAWGDANSDGFDDLLMGGSRLFLNQSGSHFIEVTGECGLEGEKITGGVWADVNLDGDLDLFCAGNGDKGDRLCLNQGNDRSGIPHFEDITDLIGEIGDNYPTEGAAWGDLQGDGRPDLYVANYESPGPDSGQGTPDFLYVNLLDSDAPLGFSFHRLGPDSGLVPPFGENLCGRGVNWGDFDNDGDQDVYVSNYRLQENFLWENQGAGKLDDRACFWEITGIERDGWWGHTIGSEWGDFDNDGDLDLITANLAHPRYIEFSNRTCLYENQIRQEGGFREVRRDWGIKYEETHSDPAWGDVDGDGDLDLYLTSVYPNRRSFLYINDLPHHSFTDVSYLAGVRVINGWGCAFSDFDNDGDLDLAVGSGEGVRLFRNRGTGNHWLEVDVEIPGSGYGTRIILRQGKDKLQLREIQGGKGTTSQHSHTAYFGLGNDDTPVTLEISYPSGKKTRLKRVRPDRKLIISGL